MSGRPVVILTALDIEYQAVRENLVDPRRHRHHQGTRFDIGRVTAGQARVALGIVGKGNQAAAVLTERAVAEFDPVAVLFVGVAGALYSHVALGDVVVATHVYAFHGGTSEDDGFKSRPRVWEISHSADQAARHVARSRAWAGHRASGEPSPNVHFGPIAAGEVVLNSRVSGHARWIHSNYNDALAIEMEGAGVAQAGHLNRALPAVVIRGISDRADGTKEATDRQRWQEQAVANAASFAVAMADELAAEEPSDTPVSTTTTRSSAMPATTQNIASGNAHVSVQAGTVYGGIRITSLPDLPTDLADSLADFHTRLQRARVAGHVDDDTYRAAEAELAVATEALRTNTPHSRGRLTLALKKVRGLIADVADLAVAIAAIITAAKELS